MSKKQRGQKLTRHPGRWLKCQACQRSGGPWDDFKFCENFTRLVRDLEGNKKNTFRTLHLIVVEDFKKIGVKWGKLNQQKTSAADGLIWKANHRGFVIYHCTILPLIFERGHRVLQDQDYLEGKTSWAWFWRTFKKPEYFLHPPLPSSHHHRGKNAYLVRRGIPMNSASFSTIASWEEELASLNKWILRCFKPVSTEISPLRSQLTTWPFLVAKKQMFFSIGGSQHGKTRRIPKDGEYKISNSKTLGSTEASVPTVPTNNQEPRTNKYNNQQVQHHHHPGFSLQLSFFSSSQTQRLPRRNV